MITRKFRVTEKLKKELCNCSPTIYMENILNLKVVTIKKPIREEIYRHELIFRINFLEVEKGSWQYTEKFYNELMRNEIKNEHLSLE